MQHLLTFFQKDQRKSCFCKWTNPSRTVMLSPLVLEGKKNQLRNAASTDHSLLFQQYPFLMHLPHFIQPVSISSLGSDANLCTPVLLQSGSVYGFDFQLTMAGSLEAITTNTCFICALKMGSDGPGSPVHECVSHQLRIITNPPSLHIWKSSRHFSCKPQITAISFSEGIKLLTGNENAEGDYR